MRLWYEPRELEGEQPQLRTYVRDLSSGEESYLADLDELLLHLVSLATGRGVRLGKNDR